MNPRLRHSRAGLNLVEALIACGVAMLLALVLINVLFPSFRLVQEGYIRTELQQQGELSLHQIQSDLQRTVPTGVSLAIPGSSSEPMIVATQPLKQFLSAGTLEFELKLLVTYHDVTRRQLFRKEWPPNPPAIALNLQTFTALQTTRPNLAMIIGQSNGTERSLAKSVEYFRVEKEPTSGGETYVCKIGLRKEIPGKNRDCVVELWRKVMLRNHQ